MSNEFEKQTGEKPALPSTLNVLTILTMIGSSLALIMSAGTSWFINFSMSMMDKAMNSGVELSAKDLQQMEQGKRALELVKANLVPLMITGILGAVLCFAGAIMMRKLKKDGLWVYVAGELLPIITGFVLMGTAQFTGVMSWIFSLVVPIVFVILYFGQRKSLVN